MTQPGEYLGEEHTNPYPEHKDEVTLDYPTGYGPEDVTPLTADEEDAWRVLLNNGSPDPKDWIPE